MKYHFTSVNEIRENNFKMLPEYFNNFLFESLQRHFEIIHNKLPIEPIADDSKDYFFNQRGAKVYMDIAKQPILDIKEGKNQYTVLSVGFSNTGTPLVNISENRAACCYSLPNDYCEWVMAMVGCANLGEKFFPEDVIFSLIDGKYYVDIL